MKYYKILSANREPVHGGSGRYPEPGVWTEERPVEPCESGYHVCGVQHLSHWLEPEAVVWEVRGKLQHQEQPNKHVWGSVSLVRPVGVLTREVLVAFARGCARRARGYADAAAHAATSAAVNAADAASAVNAADAAADAACAACAAHAADAQFAARYAAVNAADAAVLAHDLLGAAPRATDERRKQGLHLLRLLRAAK